MDSTAPDNVRANPPAERSQAAGARFLRQTAWMIATMSAASVLNVLFVALVARNLDDSSLGVFFCGWSVMLFVAAPGSAIQTFLSGLYSRIQGVAQHEAFVHWARKIVFAAAGIAAVFAAASPLAAKALEFDSVLPVLATGFVLVVYAPLPLLYGRIQGRMSFVPLGAIFLLEAGSRPAAAAVLVAASAMTGTTAIAAMAAGYFAASFAAFPWREIRGIAAAAKSSSFGRDADAGFGAGLAPTIAALLCLSAMAYFDVLFQRALVGGPGGSGSYGAAAYLGRAFLMVTVPLVTVMYPKVSLAHSRGESSWRMLRDSVIMSMFPWGFGAALCALFPVQITSALFPNQPAAAGILPWFPLAILPYVLLNVFSYYALAKRRWLIIAAVGSALGLQWGGYALFHASDFQILRVLGVSGAVALASAVAIVAAGRGVGAGTSGAGSNIQSGPGSSCQ